ncbi:metal ABC transporter solute-binding protein, Zn/Mn family [Arthrobacter monumenti]
MPKFRSTLALVAVLCLGLTACSAPMGNSSEGRASATEKPLVLTTFTVLANMARQVGGKHVRVESITKVGAEIHGYEPTPSDLKYAADADLILDNGLGLERWFKRFVASVDAPHAVLSTGIDPIPITVGEYEGEANPHAWMSPRAGQVYVANIVEALSRLVPEHAGDFRANGERYNAKLQQLMDSLEGALPPKAALVTCEGAFSYLARDASLREGYLWPVNSDTQGTPGQITDLIDFIERRDVPAVFCESTVSADAQQQVAQATGTRLITPLYVDSLSEPDGPVPSYLELLRHDISLIKEGLAGEDANANG